MLNLNDYLFYLENQRLIVCKSCRYCLQPDGVERHLRTEHEAVPLVVRKELVKYVDGLELVSFVELVSPTDVIQAFECLKVTNGFMCLICDGLYGTEESMRVYCRAMYGIVFTEST